MKDVFTLPESSAHSSHPPGCINVSLFWWITQFHLKQNLHPMNSLFQGLVPINRRWKVVLSPFPSCPQQSSISLQQFLCSQALSYTFFIPHSSQLISSDFWYETSILYMTATQPSHIAALRTQIMQNIVSMHISMCYDFWDTAWSTEETQGQVLFSVWPVTFREVIEKYKHNCSVLFGSEVRD